MTVLGQSAVSMNTAGANTYARFTTSVGSGSYMTNGSLYVALYWAATSNELYTGHGTMATNATAGTLAGIAGHPGIATNSANGLVNVASGGGNRYIGVPGVGREGVVTYFQLRAWTGGYSTYEDAVASGSPAVDVSRFAGANMAPIITNTPSIGALGFVGPCAWNPGSSSSAQSIFIAMDPVPEPGTIALIGLGVTTLIFIRRRK